MPISPTPPSGVKTRSVLFSFAISILSCQAAPAEASAQASATDARPKPKPKITVRKKSRGSGYGFLPGYPPTPRERAQRQRPEIRYYTWDGRAYYGWGGPGFYRGQYNGGSMGPCWTSTPIGMIWNCGR